ncbi:Structural maintenance of chromosomes protein 5 [Neophaeococcomyces mojaviensis]|uniref:Structural maintenance of chromosomes protein 5 n=1 Tax=Neophaeococcomyces mojaviensis TaxID=3383035 RepID=A0ACC2ZWS1_9EURO|nr:Structural maintenance of chromosomes protein 5 [Knufia sp. JES_112]
MARLNSRRSRATESETEDGLSRESTPLSTARNDRKRMRQSVSVEPDIASVDRESPPRSKKYAGSRNVEAQASRSAGMREKRKHQPGAIVRVKLTNFVTYTSAEFFPGPNLNMVIGPNGTGKSTLVCAICLGLGYPPSVLGRAKDPAEFVKHGCKEATIEIELQRATTGSNRSERNPIIVRMIKKDTNKSEFWVNGNKTSNKAVQDMAKNDFNIKCDNLCQFLPQDRVVEFAQMTPVQLLTATLDAAADPVALEYHGHLKQLREQQTNLMAHNQGDRENLQNLEKRQTSQQSEIERLRERKEIQQKIQWLELCRTIPKYQETKKRASELRKKRTDLQVGTDRLRAETAPALRKVNEKQQYADAAKRNRDQIRREVKQAEVECRKVEEEIEKFATRQQECEQRNTAEQNSAKRDKQEWGRHKQLVANYKAQKENEPEPYDTKTANERIQQHKDRLRELNQKLEDLKTKASPLQPQGKALQARKKELEDKLNNLETQIGQRESRLEELSAHTHRAWQWVKSNQQRFKKEVFGPPAVTVTVKDPRMAKALESLTQGNDLKVITAQCKDDFKILQEELTHRQRLHDVSLRVCSIDNLSGFQPPMNDEQLHNLGLEQWALDCLEGPPQVLAMLCQERYLHQCGIASNDVTQEQHDAISNSVLKSYIAGNKSVRFTRRAEYGAAGISAQIRNIRQPRVWTDRPVDDSRREQINQEIRSVNHDIASVAEAVERIRQQGKELREEREEEEEARKKLTKEKEDYQNAMTAWNGLDTKIAQAEQKMQQCEDNISRVRDRCTEILRERDDHIFAQAEIVLQYADAVNVLQERNAKLIEAEVLLVEAENDSENLKQMNQEIRNNLEKKKRELEETARESSAAAQQAQALMAEVKALKAQGEKLQADTGDNGLLELMSELTQKTEQELGGLLDSEQARLELTGGGPDAANRIQEFEERAKKIERLRNKLADFHEQQESYMTAITEIRGKFESELGPIIEKIDAAFAESFRRIGCAGTVTVHKASSEDPAVCTEETGGIENGLDFANWAIHISVTFRNNEPLQLLDSHRQSGGERAVSTIFYLMALQSLSRSPFRLVDEINQGMDPTNERMVHGRMVDLAVAAEKARAEGKDDIGGSQYFLITPKLLNGLRYERGMTVLCIVSGENMPSASDKKTRDEDGNVVVQKGRKIDFTALARRARELGTRMNDGRRVDSGVAMGGRSIQVGA